MPLTLAPPVSMPARRRAPWAFPRRALAVLVGLTLLIAACSNGESAGDTETTPPPSTAPTTTAAPDEPPSPPTAATADLETILIPADAAPTGTELAFDEGDDAVLQPVQGSPPEAQEAIRAGWLGTRLRIFFNPDMLAALEQGELSAYAANFATPGHWSVGSWVSAYQDAAAAQRALALMVREFGTAWQLARGDDPGLGDESAAFHGATDLANGTPTTIYAWRSGSYVLEVVAHGSVEPGAAELRAIAVAMQARATNGVAATSPEAQGYHHLVGLGDEAGTLLIGGFLNTDFDMPDQRAWTFSPAAGWNALSAETPVLYDAEFHSQGRVVLLLTGDPDAVLQTFDPQSGTVETLGDVPFDQEGARLAYDMKSNVTVAFGKEGATWAYDLGADTWVDLAPPAGPPGRGWHVMVYDPATDRIILFGGVDNTDRYYGDTWVYDVDANEWAEVASEAPPSPRAYAAAALETGRNRVVMFGGVFGPFLAETSLDETWAFDPQAGAWAELAPDTAPAARGWHSVAYDSAAGRIVLFGGGPNRDAYLADTWIFDPTTTTWAPAGS